MMYAMIMIPFKPALEDNIFILYVIIDKQRGLSKPLYNVFLILQKHLTILTDQHGIINY